MIDFRNKYRIIRNDDRWQLFDSQRQRLRIQIKLWWWPFWIRLKPTWLFHSLFIEHSYTLKDDFFFSIDEAEEFAKLHAEIGNKAWVKSYPEFSPGEILKELGRLP